MQFYIITLYKKIGNHYLRSDKNRNYFISCVFKLLQEQTGFIEQILVDGHI